MKTFKSACYYLLSYTWGIIMTLIGSFIAIFLLITGHTLHKFYQNIYFIVGKNWGGCNFGPFFLIDDNEGLSTKQHESGHGLQNICLGPLMPFVVGIPSMMRYHLRNRKTQERKKLFSTLVFIVSIILSILLIILGIVLQSLPLLIMGVFILIYFATVYIWLMCKEIPQYENSTPSYYSIWFEGNASKIGKKYYPEDDEVA